MNTNFAEVVEDIKQLSFDEKRELKDLLEISLIEERRRQIFEIGEQSKQESQNGELKFSSNLDELRTALNN